LLTLRELRQEHPHVGKLVIVSLEDKARKTDDGIVILPYKDFCQRLWLGEIF
jgi:hypothetical protein